ncbi:nucleoside phosphorylase [Streptomyces sp. NPDC014646]|uniref:nucleoside phosphorylase n=1 Tax=unclassified Streptomyces TaxID=2593676 RepID=UPI0036F99E69
MNGRFPLHPGKHALPAVPDPAEHTAYVKARQPTATLAGLGGAVLVYQRRVLERAASSHRCRRLDWVRGDLYVLKHRGRWLAVCGGFGLGAPAAALVVEQLVALGIRRVITVGTAASLRADLRAGELVVCDRALRDEGVSHHYLAPGSHVRPSRSLTECLVGALRARDVAVRRGTGWTTDAPYRETAAEVARYGSDGTLTADMEAAGVFAVAKHRRVAAAAAFVVTDSLVDRRPREDRPNTLTVLHTAVEAALSALADAPDGPRRRG